jgi:hypothetical protein
VAIALAHTAYFEKTIAIYVGEGLGKRILRVAQLNAISWGELLLNGPWRRGIRVVAEYGLPIRDVVLVYQLVGLAGLLATAWSFIRWSRPGPVITAYALVFSVIMFLWPLPVVRLWLPIWPLLLGWLGVAGVRLARNRAGALVVALYVGWMAITGLVGHALSTRIALSGDAFPSIYGDGTLASTYRKAFNGLSGNERFVDRSEKVAGPNDVFLDAYNLLVLYEPRASEDLKRMGPIPAQARKN